MPSLQPGTGLPDENSDLVAEGTKEDTGYLSTRAVELDGVVEGEMIFEATDQTRNFLEQDWYIRSRITDQVKFGKGQLDTARLHLNLVPDTAPELQTSEADGRIHVRYRVRMEALVSTADLGKMGIVDPAQLANQSFTFRVPANPDGASDRLGTACVTGYDAGTLSGANYFYYFNPDLPGCTAELTTARLALRAVLPTTDPYPEYDLLAADGRVEVVAFFGEAEHTPELSDDDWGMRGWREVRDALLERGFSAAGVADPATGKGMRLARFSGGLDEVVDLINPQELRTLRDDTTGLFGRAVRSHEIVLYLGHSFYGSLSVLDDQANYAPDLYQIFLIGSCWSYEYYTKQVFRHKATTADPTGWALADVVNNSQVEWFHNNGAFSRILLTNLFRGAETGGADAERRYHWRNILDVLNRHAVSSQQANGTEVSEIIGASGVRSNRYAPPGVLESSANEMLLAVASEHPVPEGSQLRYTAVAPLGSRSLRVHFTAVDVEPGYDRVRVLDANDVEIASYDGVQVDMWTPTILGDFATIELTTDASNPSWGFDIDRVDFQE